MGSKAKVNVTGLWKIILAIVLGMVIGSQTQQGNTIFGFELYPYLYPIYALLGKLFINALMLLVVPLVFSSIMLGVARIGGEQSFGRVGLKTFAAYATTNLLGILIGLLFVNLLQPGVGISQEIAVGKTIAGDIPVDPNQAGLSLSVLLLQIIPSNIFYTLSQGQMLGIIFFSMVFGFCLSNIENKLSVIMIQVVEAIFQTMLQFTHLIMKIMPIGVFFLVAKIFTETGLQALGPLSMFTLTVLLALLSFFLIALPLLLKLIARVSPIKHIKAMSPALFAGFSTSSTSATLPITIDCLEERAGVSNKITSLVLPLATSLNLAGSALYVCVGSIFVAQAYEVDLNIATQALIVLIAFITSFGIAGIPSASLVVIIAILHAIQVPAEGIGLFIAVDRLLDMCRTTVSVFTGSCSAILVATSEGEKVLNS